MLLRVVFAFLSLSLFCSASDARYAEKKDQSWDLAPNSQVDIHVRAADVHVIEGKEGKLTLQVLTESSQPNYAAKIKTTFVAATGVLTVTQPLHGGSIALGVSIPPGTDVAVHSRAGDIDIDTPTGSKDIETTAGDVNLIVGSSQQYSAIDVSTHAGDVSGLACGKPKGWIGHSLQCIGGGRDRIHVHTFAGDVALREGEEVAGQRDFDFELGSWNIHLKKLMHPLTGAKDWIEFDGTSVTRKLWDGRAQIEQFETDGAGGHIEGLTLRTFNPKTHQWYLWWANAKDGMVGPPQVGQFKDGVGEFYGTDTLNGKPILIRFIWSKTDTDKPHFEQSFSEDGGKTWEVNWITDQVRVK
jgi:hypothetical protein